jgi:hypothetical protein
MGAQFKTGLAITPHDTNDIPGGVIQGLYVGTAGDGIAVVVWADGTTSTLAGLVAGRIYPAVIRRVNATGTGVSDLVGLRH